MKKVKIIAHRGASFHAPENTIASAKLGWDHQADAVEIDIHLSADKKIIVMHDSNTKRTTGEDLKIADTPSDKLRTLDAGNWKSESYKGEKVPFLSEILNAIPKGKQLVIEIKSNKELVPILKEEIEKSGKLKQCIIISFDFDALVEAKKALPKIPSYYLSSKIKAEEIADWSTRLKEAKVDGLNLNWSSITPELAQQCIKYNIPLLAWTIDDPEVAKKLIALGVTGVTTNKPL
ncbi:MAG TPA: glycerophosphodiester phosphodiesterase family protein, partial [Bacteroidales bacterium]|nr:glycerophosphodiester phosphodiesterase family protein [Bacteroidales bacterium]